MKNLFLAGVFLTIVISCGKKSNSKPCQNRDSMITKCRVAQTPNYGRAYAQEICEREYTSERCY